MLERSTSAKLVRSVSAQAEATVKDNVDLVRRPSQQMGSHFDKSFKGVVAEGRAPGRDDGLGARAAAAATAKA